MPSGSDSRKARLSGAQTRSRVACPVISECSPSLPPPAPWWGSTKTTLPRHQCRLRDPGGGSKPLGRAGTRVLPSGEIGKAYPVIGNQPPPGTCCVQRLFLVPGEGGLLGRVLSKPPARPARPSGSPEGKIAHNLSVSFFFLYSQNWGTLIMDNPSLIRSF